MGQNINISDTSGDSYGTTNNNLDGWTFDVDLTDPGVVVVSGDMDLVDTWTGESRGEADDGYEFGALSTGAYGSLAYDETDGTFTFTIDKQAVFASGADQTVSFTVVGSHGGSADDDFVHINLLICVARGTLIETPDGHVAVEDLETGDLVWTRDSGMQPIRWIGSRKVGREELRAVRPLRPVMIRAGALGPDRPVRDLVVSQQHKILIDDWRAELIFGETEVLAPAKGLVNDRSIRVDHSCTPVEYFHLLFEQHQIIRTNGAETESFRPGSVTLNEIDRGARNELLALFPELRRNVDSYGPAARCSVTVSEARALGGRLQHVA